MILSGINSVINSALGNVAVAVALEVVSGILIAPLMAGLIMLCVRRVAGAETSFSMIGNYYDRILPLFAVNFLVVIIASLGMLVLVLPGIYLAVAYAMAVPLLVDKKMGVWEAMETSRKAITQCWFRYFGLLLLSFALILIGMLALGIGLIWMAPMVTLMYASVYHEMFGFEGDA